MRKKHRIQTMVISVLFSAVLATTITPASQYATKPEDNLAKFVEKMYLSLTEKSEEELTKDKKMLEKCISQIQNIIDAQREKIREKTVENLLPEDVIHEIETNINDSSDGLFECTVCVNENTISFIYTYHIDMSTIKDEDQATFVQAVADNVNGLRAKVQQQMQGIINAMYNEGVTGDVTLNLTFQTIDGHELGNQSIIMRKEGVTESRVLAVDNDWENNFQFAIDGKTYQVPTKVQDFIDNGWACDSIAYVINPQSSIVGDIKLFNDKYQPEYYENENFQIHLNSIRNTSESIVPIEDGEAQSIHFGCMRNVGKVYKNYPDIRLPGGITWGSTKETILKAYGDRCRETYRSDNLGYTVYTCTAENNEMKSMTLIVYDNFGLADVRLTCYD